MKKIYPSDLTDSQWNHIKEFFEKKKGRGRPQELELRMIVNAILYLLVSGCQWRYLPTDYPNWHSVYYHFRKWSKDGAWKQVHDTLRAEVRRKSGRHKHPTAGSLDSQSVKTTSVAGENRGFDAGKNIKGRKRHIVVDTLGLVLTTVVTSASIQDRDGAKMLLKRLDGSSKKLRKIWVDGGYRGILLEWVKLNFRFCLEVVLRSENQIGFVILPRRFGG